MVCTSLAKPLVKRYRFLLVSLSCIVLIKLLNSKQYYFMIENEEETEKLYSEGPETHKLYEKSRKGFISKVYSLLCVQLTITCIFVIIAINSTPLRLWMLNNKWLIWVAFIISLVTCFSLACFPSISRTVPINYIFMLIFTAAESYLV